MCEPVSGSVLVGMMLATTALAGYSAYTSAQHQKGVANYQAKVAKNNAQSAEWAAQDAERRGKETQIENRRKYAAMQGTQRAALSARGLDVGEGSALAILSDTELFQEIDKGRIGENAAREAWAVRNQKTNYLAQSELNSADARAINPALAGVSAMLNGGTQVASKWYTMGAA